MLYLNIDFHLKKGTRSLVTGDSSSIEESHRREIEREKMEKEKYQREIEEMRKKFSKLPTSPSPLEVNQIK